MSHGKMRGKNSSGRKSRGIVFKLAVFKGERVDTSGQGIVSESLESKRKCCQRLRRSKQHSEDRRRKSFEKKRVVGCV